MPIDVCGVPGSFVSVLTRATRPMSYVYEKTLPEAQCPRAFIDSLPWISEEKKHRDQYIIRCIYQGIKEFCIYVTRREWLLASTLYSQLRLSVQDDEALSSTKDDREDPTSPERTGLPL